LVIMNIITILFSLLLLLPSPKEENKISEWRGKDRMGIYQETNLLKVWPTAGPKEIWSIDGIGRGYTSPVFTEDRFFITGEIDSMAVLFCYNLNGEKLWQTKLGKEWKDTNPGPRSTPTIVNDLIYVGTGMGNLYCIKSDNGKIVWSKELASDFGAIPPRHGHSEAALTDGDKVFWTAGGKEKNVVALNRFTGKLIWANKGFGENSAYNAPKLVELSSRKMILTFSMYHLMAFDTETGVLLWSHEQTNIPLEKRGPGFGDTHGNTVLYENGSVYYAAGDGNGGVKLNLSNDGSKITQVWCNSEFDSYMGGIVKIGDYLYGSGTIKTELKSINANTGQLTDSLKIGSGAVISADNMLYYYTQKGDMILLKYNQGKIEKVSSFRIKKGTEQHFTHPVINKGILYQRHGNVLMAFDIRL